MTYRVREGYSGFPKRYKTKNLQHATTNGHRAISKVLFLGVYKILGEFPSA
jgi:hypothetical protein